MGFFGSSSKTINQFSTSPLYKPGMTSASMIDQFTLSKHSGLSSRDAFKSNLESLRSSFNMYQLNGLLGNTSSTSIYTNTLDTSVALASIQANVDPTATSVVDSGDTTYNQLQELYISSKHPSYSPGSQTLVINGKTYNLLPSYPGVLKYKESDSSALNSIIGYNGSSLTTSGYVWNVVGTSFAGDTYQFSISFYVAGGAPGEYTAGSGTVTVTIVSPEIINLQGNVTPGTVNVSVTATITGATQYCSTAGDPPVTTCVIEANAPISINTSSNISYPYKYEETYITDATQILDKYVPTTTSASIGGGYILKSVTPGESYGDGGVGFPVSTYWYLGPVSIPGLFISAAYYAISSIERVGDVTTLFASRPNTDGESGGEASGETIDSFVLPPVDLIDFQLYGIYAGKYLLVEYISGGATKLGVIPYSDDLYIKEEIGITPFVPLKEAYDLTNTDKVTKVALRSLGIDISEDEVDPDSDELFAQLDDSKIRDAYIYMGINIKAFFGTDEDTMAMRNSSALAGVAFETLKTYSHGVTTVENLDDPAKFKIIIQRKPSPVTSYGVFSQSEVGTYSVTNSTTGTYDESGFVEDSVQFHKIVSTAEKQTINIVVNTVGFSLALLGNAHKDRITLNGADVWLDDGALPIPLDVVRKLGYQDKMVVYDYCLQIGVRVLYTIKLKWYQISFFRAIIWYASAILSIYTGGFAGFVLWSAGQAGLLPKELALLDAAIRLYSGDWSAIGAGTASLEAMLNTAAQALNVINIASSIYYERQIGNMTSAYTSKQQQLEDMVEEQEEDFKNNKNWNLLARYNTYEDPIYDPFNYMNQFWYIAYGDMAHDYEKYYEVPDKLTL